MPNYFYVKSGGTLGVNDDTPYSSAQTGSFSGLTTSNYYPDVSTAITAGTKTSPFTSGDFICVSDAHSKTYSADTTFQGPTTGAYGYIVSVDDSNVDAEKAPASAQETAASTYDFIFKGRLYFSSISISGATWFYFNDDAADIVFDKCTYTHTSTSYWIIFGNIGNVSFRNTTLALNSGSISYFRYGAIIEFIGCTFTGVTDLFTTSTGATYGTQVSFVGCDLSSVTGYLLQNGGNDAANDDTIKIEYMGCKLNGTEPGFAAEVFKRQNHRLIVSNCSGSSAAAEYQYHVTALGGVLDEETSIYRDGSTAYPDSNQKVSLKVSTNSDASKGTPFWFDFPTRFCALSSTASDNIRLYFICNSILYDSDVWVEVTYQDGTNKHTPNFISTRHTDIMDAGGSSLSTNTESWTGRGSEYRYHIDIDTSTDAGMDCIPEIRLHIAKSNQVMYFCPTLELS